ncbi:GTP cyclohydrolase, FolE2/MptA family, partial [bacterium]|nr:GTP cyclohydrolase, FolE2/MptA family [bacterium]MDB4399673.1 GTP cyclohydrolase, FolE2/MptA family [bacterium]
AQLFSVIKRNDEKHVTEQAYENPKFVEDTVRDLADSLKSDSRIKWFRCSVENFESIHSHNAFAEIVSDYRS